MTDSLLQKVEDKVMHLLAELDILRKEILQLKQDNVSLRAERTDHNKKLQGLISLLDMLDFSEHAHVSNDLSTLQTQEAHC